MIVETLTFELQKIRTDVPLKDCEVHFFLNFRVFVLFLQVNCCLKMCLVFILTALCVSDNSKIIAEDKKILQLANKILNTF